MLQTKKTIKLIAPASGTDPNIIEQLRKLGHLHIDIPHNILAENSAFHANSDEERLLQLKHVLYDSSNNTIIWALRGGYGSARLLEQLQQSKKPEIEKIFIGFSDITALHLFLSQQWQWKTIHGAGLAKILDPNQDPENFQRIEAIISKREKNLVLDPLLPLNTAALNTPKIAGRITGGNLSIIQTSIGTSWQIQTADKILFLEDVGEKGYKIDRTLNHIKQTGLFNGVKAIVFGQFTDSLDTSEAPVAIERFANDTDIPVFKNEQFGHGNINYPIVYNADSEIRLNKNKGNFTWTMHLDS